MSYHIEAKITDVAIPADKLGECLGAVYKVTREDVDGEEFLLREKTSLRDLLEYWGIYTRPTEDGGMQLDYVEEGFDGSIKIFEAIAPFVDLNSWPDGPTVECRGEDGAMWRFYFADGKVVRQHPVITWVAD
jgi:hypothetical protein